MEGVFTAELGKSLPDRVPCPAVEHRDPERHVGKWALTTLVATIALVGVGGYTRGSGSGFGCEDRWPLCEGGNLGGLLPAAEREMIIEWSHRWLAATVGLLAVTTAVLAWRHLRDRRVVTICATAAVVVIGIQAWVGREIVSNELDSDLVSLHLGISMIIVGLLATLAVATAGTRFSAVTESSQPPDGQTWIPAKRSRVRILGAAAAGAYLLILLGSYVHNQYYEGWPLMEGSLIPEFGNTYRVGHFLHRTVAGIGIVVLGILGAQGARRRVPPLERLLLLIAAAFYAVNVLLGLVHVVTEVTSAFVVMLHLVVAATVWASLVGAAVATNYRARSEE